jgi:hypothetical protein
MDKFVVTGIPAFNGEYPMDPDQPFTMRELNIIKRISGVRAGGLSEAVDAGDTDVMLAMSVIAVRRAGGKWEAFEQMAWETEAGAITLVGTEEVADEAAPLTNANSGSNDDTPPLSGERSRTVGDEIPAKNLRAIGSQV